MKELIQAAKEGDTIRVKQILQTLDSNPNRISIVNERAEKKEDAYEATALVWAAAHGDPEMVTALLDAGADINKTDRFDRTPLVKAVLSYIEYRNSNQREITMLLMQRGADNSIAFKNDYVRCAIIPYLHFEPDQAMISARSALMKALCTSRLASESLLIAAGERKSTHEIKRLFREEKMDDTLLAKKLAEHKDAGVVRTVIENALPDKERFYTLTSATYRQATELKRKSEIQVLLRQHNMNKAFQLLSDYYNEIPPGESIKQVVITNLKMLSEDTDPKLTDDDKQAQNHARFKIMQIYLSQRTLEPYDIREAKNYYNKITDEKLKDEKYDSYFKAEHVLSNYPYDMIAGIDYLVAATALPQAKDQLNILATVKSDPVVMNYALIRTGQEVKDPAWKSYQLAESERKTDIVAACAHYKQAATQGLLLANIGYVEFSLLLSSKFEAKVKQQAEKNVTDVLLGLGKAIQTETRSDIPYVLHHATRLLNTLHPRTEVSAKEKQHTEQPFAYYQTSTRIQREQKSHQLPESLCQYGALLLKTHPDEAIRCFEEAAHFPLFRQQACNEMYKCALAQKATDPARARQHFDLINKQYGTEHCHVDATLEIAEMQYANFVNEAPAAIENYFKVVNEILNAYRLNDTATQVKLDRILQRFETIVRVYPGNTDAINNTISLINRRKELDRHLNAAITQRPSFDILESIVLPCFDEKRSSSYLDNKALTDEEKRIFQRDAASRLREIYSEKKIPGKSFFRNENRKYGRGCHTSKDVVARLTTIIDKLTMMPDRTTSTNERRSTALAMSTLGYEVLQEDESCSATPIPSAPSQSTLYPPAPLYIPTAIAASAPPRKLVLS